jgi:hypothetical protein
MLTVLLFSQGLVPSVARAFAYARGRLAGRKP